MEFKFFKGVIKGPFTIDPFQSVPENFRVESVGPILYNPHTFIPIRNVHCRHIVTEQLYTFRITDTHWLWDFNTIM